MTKKKSKLEQEKEDYLAKINENLANVRYFAIYFWGRDDFKKVTRDKAITILFAKKYGLDFYLEGGSFAGKSVWGVEPIPEPKRVLNREFLLSPPRPLTEIEKAEKSIATAKKIMETSRDLYHNQLISKESYERHLLKYESIKTQFANIILEKC